MAAATKNRLTKQRDGTRFNDPVRAATRIFGGTMVALDSAGNAKPAAAADAVMRGIANAEVDNREGAAGALSVDTDRSGAFLVFQTGLDRTDIGSSVYVVDDQTVGATGTLIAGKLVDLDAAGAWIEFL